MTGRSSCDSCPRPPQRRVDAAVAGLSSDSVLVAYCGRIDGFDEMTWSSVRPQTERDLPALVAATRSAKAVKRTAPAHGNSASWFICGTIV